MNKHTTVEERKQMVALAQQGWSTRQIAQHLGYAPSTVRKWRRRYREQGEQGLFSRMGRPKKGPLSTFSPALRQTLLALRRAQPGWGPRSLLAFLRQKAPWQGERLPSPAQVALFLREAGLVRRRQRRSRLPQVETSATPQPHEEWEMDAQGQITISGLGKGVVINMVDRATALHVGVLACPEVRKPNGEHYRMLCRLAFSRFGLPKRISLDHDTAFVGVSSRSPFPTSFVLWLVALGIEVRFIQAPPPWEHARVEGRHALTYAQALQGRSLRSWDAVQQALETQQHFTNAVYPVPALGHRPRLSAFPQARHSGRGYHPQHEAEMLDLHRVKVYLSQGRWYRQVNRQGQCSLGGQSYTLGQAWAGRQVAMTYDLERDALRFIWQDEILYRPMKGLDKATLMGQHVPWLLPTATPWQPPLPFPPQAVPLQAFLATTFPDWLAIRH